MGPQHQPESAEFKNYSNNFQKALIIAFMCRLELVTSLPGQLCVFKFFLGGSDFLHRVKKQTEEAGSSRIYDKVK